MHSLHILKQLLQNVIQIDCNSLFFFFLLDLHKTQLSPTEHLVKKKTQEVQNVAVFIPGSENRKGASILRTSSHFLYLQSTLKIIQRILTNNTR